MTEFAVLFNEAESNSERSEESLQKAMNKHAYYMFV
jgi:hypothetical protein